MSDWFRLLVTDATKHTERKEKEDILLLLLSLYTIVIIVIIITIYYCYYYFYLPILEDSPTRFFRFQRSALSCPSQGRPALGVVVVVVVLLLLIITIMIMITNIIMIMIIISLSLSLLLIVIHPRYSPQRNTANRSILTVLFPRQFTKGGLVKGGLAICVSLVQL